MPMLFSLGMHPALVAVQERLRPTERIFAFLDDVCVVCLPERVQSVVSILAAELWAHARIQVHDGKTQVWNRACEEPAGVHELTMRARILDPNAVVWRGDVDLDPSQRGLKVLGSPIGSDEFVRTQLRSMATKHATLLQRIPAVRDLQSAWLLLLFCAVPRANFHLRMVSPHLSEEFAEAHDNALWQCFCRLVGIAGESAEARRAAGVPMNMGGLGLCLAAGSAEAAHWASWADCIPSVKRRHPDVAEAMVTLLSHHAAPSFEAVRRCADTLREAQFEVPSWEAVLAGLPPGQSEDDNPVEPKHG